MNTGQTPRWLTPAWAQRVQGSGGLAPWLLWILVMGPDLSTAPHQTCLQLGTLPPPQLACAWVPVSRSMREGPCGYGCCSTMGGMVPLTQQAVPGPLPIVPLCFPDQPPPRPSHAPCLFTPRSLSKRCSLGLEHCFFKSSGPSGNMASGSHSLGQSCHVLLQPPCTLINALGTQSRCLLGNLCASRGTAYLPAKYLNSPAT